MSFSTPRRTSVRPARLAVVAVLLLMTAAVAGLLAHQSLASSLSPWPSPFPVASRSSGSESPTDTSGGAGDAGGAARGEAGGSLPDGVTVFDDGYPGVAKLDPDLLRALRAAAVAAEGDRVTFQVNSGWRSRAYQERLLREAVARYGSIAEAARWVATPDTSLHVSGDAVDIGETDATDWLSEHGARYGLCQTYRNEPWHFELHPEAVDGGCPPMYADPTEDPRMQSSSSQGSVPRRPR